MADVLDCHREIGSDLTDIRSNGTGKGDKGIGLSGKLKAGCRRTAALLDHIPEGRLRVWLFNLHTKIMAEYGWTINSRASPSALG